MSVRKKHSTLYNQFDTNEIDLADEYNNINIEKVQKFNKLGENNHI